MQYCTKCGANLPENAEFCTKCGTPIKSSNQKTKEIKDKKSIEEKIEKTAEEIGRKAEQIGKKMEKKAENVGNNINQWYDNTFKIAGPLIGAFIGLIVLRIIVFIIQVSGDNIFILTALGEGIHEYLLIIFASMLLSGYNTYFYRKFKPQYQWVYPLISAIGFIFGAWIVAQIMLIVSQSNSTPIIKTIGTFINTYLIAIFIIALIIAYAAQFAFNPDIYREKWKK
jgi:ribosomal protein L40E